MHMYANFPLTLNTRDTTNIDRDVVKGLLHAIASTDNSHNIPSA